MHPKSWRKSKKLTLQALSERMEGIATGYISEIENGVKKPSGRVLTFYHKLSKGAVTPTDFVLKKPKKTDKKRL